MSQSGPDADFLLQLKITRLVLCSLSYGIYLVLSITTAYLLSKNGQGYSARNITRSYLALMFALATPWYIFVVISWEDITPSLVAKIFAMLQYLLSDGVLLYRMYMAWQGDLRITVLGGIGYLASVAFGILSELPSSPNLDASIRLAFLITTIVFNAFVTLAIALKLLPLMTFSRRNSLGGAGSVLKRMNATVLLFFENGALYTMLGIGNVVVGEVAPRSMAANVLAVAFQILAFLGPAIVLFRITIELPGHCTCQHGPGSMSLRTISVSEGPKPAVVSYTQSTSVKPEGVKSSYLEDV